MLVKNMWYVEKTVTRIMSSLFTYQQSTLHLCGLKLYNAPHSGNVAALNQHTFLS